MIHEIAKGLLAFALLSEGANRVPEKLLLQFETNPATDGTPDACVLVQAMDFETHDKVDFQPPSTFMAAACAQFLLLRRKMIRPGDASSFDKWPDSAVWLQTDPDVPQPVPSGALQ